MPGSCAAGASVCLVLLFAPCGNAGAQTAAAERARLAAVEDTLQSILNHFRKPLLALGPTSDTVRAGAIALRAEAEYFDLARATAPIAWDLVGRVFGQGANELAELGLVFTIKRADEQTAGRIEILRERTDSLGRRVVDVLHAYQSTPEYLARIIAGRAVSDLIDSFWPRRFGWPMAGSFVTEEYDRAAANQFIELAVSPDVTARVCAAGGIEGCRQILRLDQTMNTATLRTSGGTVLLPYEHMMLFFPLFRFALLIGGSGTIDRFRAAQTPIVGERLAVAAGVPVDSLVRAWRADFVTCEHCRSAPRLNIVIGLLLVSALALVVSHRRPRLP